VSAIADLKKMVDRLERLVDREQYGETGKALAVEKAWTDRAASVVIKTPAQAYNYGQGDNAGDAQAAKWLQGEMISRYKAHGRMEGTKALEAVRAEIHQIRLHMPCAVAAAFAEAQQIASGLAIEVAERRAEP